MTLLETFAIVSSVVALLIVGLTLIEIGKLAKEVYEAMESLADELDQTKSIVQKLDDEAFDNDAIAAMGPDEDDPKAQIRKDT